MDSFVKRIRELIKLGEVIISEHGYDELADDGLSARELLDGVNEAVLIEEYPDYPKGHCVLLFQKDHEGNPVHVVWGIPKRADKPAVLVTAYRPSADRWSNNFLKRR